MFGDDLEAILDVLEDDEGIKKWFWGSSELAKCWRLYFWFEFSTNTLENVQNVSVNSHEFLVLCIYRASKNSVKCVDLLQHFNLSAFIYYLKSNWSQKQREVTIKISKLRTMFAYNRPFANPLCWLWTYLLYTMCSLYSLFISLLYSFLFPDLSYRLWMWEMLQNQNMQTPKVSQLQYSQPTFWPRWWTCSASQNI